MHASKDAREEGDSSTSSEWQHHWLIHSVCHAEL